MGTVRAYNVVYHTIKQKYLRTRLPSGGFNQKGRSGWTSKVECAMRMDVGRKMCDMVEDVELPYCKELSVEVTTTVRYRVL